MDTTISSRRDLRRRAEAGHWLLRLQEDQFPEEQVEAWLRWSSDAENLAEFDAQQSLYSGLLGNPAVAALEHDGGRNARSDSVLGLRQEHGSREIGSHPRQARRRLPRRLLAAAASVFLALGTGALLWSSTPGRSLVAAHNYSTGKAIHREIALPDGSHAVLGADSKLSVAYDGQRRRVTVEAGEAYFEVRKDSRRPFVVEARGLSVTAVGTAFDVRTNDDRVVVTVAEGTVDVERQPIALQTDDSGSSTQQGPTQVRARSGERVTLVATVPAFTVTTVSPSAASNWRNGSLEFAGEPLHVVIANLNRYLASEITIRDAEVGRLVYSGTVQPARVGEWLQALSEVFPLRIAREENGSLTLLRADRPRRVDS